MDGKTGYGEKTYEALNAPGSFWSNNVFKELLSDSRNESGSAFRLNRNNGNVQFRFETDKAVKSFRVYLAHWNATSNINITVKYSLDSEKNWTEVENPSLPIFTKKQQYELFSHDFESLISPNEGEKLYIVIDSDGGERLIIDDFEVKYVD